MSYGVALRNGVPFTLGTIAALCVNATTQWNPLSLWPDGIATPGMWISPRDLTSQWADYTGTTPVVTPGTVADSANPVGLALDIRAGAPEVLGPELVVNGDFSAGTTGWTNTADGTVSVTGGVLRYTIGSNTVGGVLSQVMTFTSGKMYEVSLDLVAIQGASTYIYIEVLAGSPDGYNVPGTITYKFVAYGGTSGITIRAAGTPAPGDWFEIDNISVREVPGNHMLQSTSTSRPLLSAYDGQTLGPGDTYDSAGYPVFQLYDGVDDGMATAAFAAGTLIDGMDCLIVVRWDSAALPAIGGLYQADQTKYFGVIGIGSGDGAPTYGGCGTPTIFVDGVSVANTRGALYDALGVGEWHILEYRGLDLSAWVNAAWGAYPIYLFNGPRGDIMLYPSTDPTEDKDAARQWLADYYGVTLP